jgi:membrane protease YdiL (CAAX protease family)
LIINRQKIIRRLLLLRNLEFFNIFFLPVCLDISLKSREVLHWQPYGFGMFMICLVLARHHDPVFHRAACDGRSSSSPQFSITTPLILFAVFFVAAIGEELGWMGYVIDPLQDRFGALGGALLLGGVWAIWHLIPLLSVQRSLAWIAWWALGTVAMRVIITWLYNNTGRSVFIAVIFHAMFNLTWQLFPNNGSYYDPRVTSLIMALVAVGVVIASGPHTLVRFQGSQEPDMENVVSMAKI